MNRRQIQDLSRRDYRPHGLGNRNAARTGTASFVILSDGRQVSGIDQVTGRVRFVDASTFPLVCNTPQGVKAFLRKAARLDSNFSAEAFSVTHLPSNQ